MRISTLLFIVLAACSSKDAPKDPGPASGTAVAPVKDDGSVEVLVDGASVVKLAAKDLAAWPRLDTLVPQEARRLGTWMTLSFTTGGEPKKLERPAQVHPDMVPVVFPGKDGKPAF